VLLLSCYLLLNSIFVPFPKMTFVCVICKSMNFLMIMCICVCVYLQSVLLIIIPPSVYGYAETTGLFLICRWTIFYLLECNWPFSRCKVLLHIERIPVFEWFWSIKIALTVSQFSLAPYRCFVPFTQAFRSVASIFTDLTERGKIKPLELVCDVLGELQLV